MVARRIRPLAGVLLLAAPLARADTDSQAFVSFTLNKRLENGWRLFGEIQPRFGDSMSRHTQNVYRAAVGRNVGRNLTLYGGYAWSGTLQRYRAEDRYYLQASVDNRQGLWTLAYRTRLEFRQIEGTYGTTVRLRHQAKGAVRLPKMAPWSAVLSGEGFVNLASVARGPEPGFDQFRGFVGLSRPLGSGLSVEFGYLGVWVATPRTRHLDVLNVTLSYAF